MPFEAGILVRKNIKKNECLLRQEPTLVKKMNAF